MLKKLLLGTVLLSTSLFSNAGIISIIDGADMAGIEVTAFFGDGSQETQTWNATSLDSGAAVSTDWSLSLSGETFGEEISPGVFNGLWVFTNLNRLDGVVGIEVNGAIADVYFDDLDSVEHTVGSGVGRPFAADSLSVGASFTDMYSAPDLFGTLNISWLGGTSLEEGQVLNFLTDTDKGTVTTPPPLPVSEPATALIFLSGLLALVNIRRKL